MSTQSLYCHNCNKTYTVRIEDIQLMQQHDANFDAKSTMVDAFLKI